MTLLDICRMNDLSIATAEKALANLQDKGLITGFVPGSPDAEIQMTDEASKYTVSMMDAGSDVPASQAVESVTAPAGKAELVKPRWNPSVGDVLYQCTAYVDDKTNTVSVPCDEWVVRSVLNRTENRGTRFERKVLTAYLVEKNVLTWVKKSKRHHDFGWADSIPAFLRKTQIVENGMPYGLLTTKRQAVVHQIKSLKESIANDKKRLQAAKTDNDSRMVKLLEESIQEEERVLPFVTGCLTRMDNKAKKSKAQKQLKQKKESSGNPVG